MGSEMCIRDRTEGIGMMTKGDFQNCKFNDLRGGVLVLGRDRIVKMQYFFSSCCIHEGIFQIN